MTNVFGSPQKVDMKRRLFAIGIGALERTGWTVEKVEGSGKSSVRRITKGAESKIVSIRTTQDKWIAFPRTEKDKKWRTLDEVDAVVPVSVDSRHNPKFAKVHMIDGDEMRARFNRAYAARKAAGHTIPIGRGVWISLYHSEAQDPVSLVGAGVGLQFPAFATVPIELGAIPVRESTYDESLTKEDAPLTIAEAKRRLATALGVEPANIKITVEA